METIEKTIIKTLRCKYCGQPRTIEIKNIHGVMTAWFCFDCLKMNDISDANEVIRWVEVREV